MGRATYNCAGLRIESPVALAASVDSGEPDIVFVEGEPWAGERKAPPGDVIAERLIDGVPTYRFTRCGDRVLASFYTLADFELDLAQRRIVSHPRPGTDRAIIPILLTGTITAFLLSMDGAWSCTPAPSRSTGRVSPSSATAGRAKRHWPRSSAPPGTSW